MPSRPVPAAALAHLAPSLRPLARAVRGLTPDPENARRHDERNVEAIMASLERFGQQKPVVVRGRVVVAGSGTLEAARRLGWTHLAVVRTNLGAREAKAFGLADNRTAELATWEPDALREALAAVGEDLAVGWEGDELETLLASATAPLDAVEEEPEPPLPPPPRPRKALSRRGEVYALGPHRILCGDALLEDALAPLMGEDRAGCYLTDPPYAIYGSSSGLSASVTDDEIVRPFFRDVLRLARTWSRLFAHVYVFCDWRSWAAWWDAAKQADVDVQNMLVWPKGRGGRGSHYSNVHELLLFAASLPPQTTMSQRGSGQRLVEGKPNVLPAFGRVLGRRRLHNAEKPVALCRHLLENSTDPGDWVLDPFAGSGATLVAAHEAGRVWRGADKDPRWVDVVRRRYARLVEDPSLSPDGKL